jgi:hypothetical protein
MIYRSQPILHQLKVLEYTILQINYVITAAAAAAAAARL